MLVDSYFYSDFVSSQAKEQASRGALAFIIKNYILRCKNVPRVIAYNYNSSSERVHFATQEGMYLGMIEYTPHNNKYTMSNSTITYGSIHGSNTRHFAETTKSSYVIMSITKDRVSMNTPAEEAANIPVNWFKDMMGQILYKYREEIKKQPKAPPTITIGDMAHITPILLDGALPISLPTSVRSKIEEINKYLNNRSDSHIEWENNVNEMFGREKWVVMPRLFVDNTRVFTVGAFSFTDHARAQWIKNPDEYYVAAKQIQITQPFTTYRILEDLPDELQGLLTMQQHMLRNSHSHYVSGTDNMVPYTGPSVSKVIWPEMNSGVYDVAGDTVAYIFDK